MKVDVNVVGLAKVKTMLELLNSYIDELPADLVNSVIDLLDCKEFEIEGFVDDFKIEIDGLDVGNKYRITSINRILKTIKHTPLDGDGNVIVCGKNILEEEIQHKLLKAFSGDKIIAEWEK